MRRLVSRVLQLSLLGACLALAAPTHAQLFRIRFHHDKDGSGVTSGGSVDDVALTGACS